MLADHDVSAHATGQVHDDVDLTLANALDHFAVVARFHAERAGLGLTHMNVHDGRAGLRRRDGGGRYLFRGDCAMGALGYLGVITGNRTGNDDVVVHGASLAGLRGGYSLYYIHNNI